MLSHYRLVERIGEGGMGVVWKAEDVVLGRMVAIKVLPAAAARDEDRRNMFRDEAKLASTLNHSHIVQVYDLGCEGGLDFIVMELVEGRPLSRALQGRPLSVDRVAGLGLQVAQAVSSAHHRGLLHRDIKPANIIVTPEGNAKVVDFGLATLFERRDSTLLSGFVGRTESMPLHKRDPSDENRGGKAIAGTIPYMSPEQVRIERLDARSDIFSLGTVLYEMTTGERPFRGATTEDIVRALLKCQPSPPHEIVPRIPLDLERIIQKAMAPRPADRYQTMDDLAVDLKRLVRELDSGSSPSFEDLVGRTKRPRTRVVVGLAGVGLLGILALASWFMTRQIRARPDRPSGHELMIVPLQVHGQAEGAEYAGQALAEAIAVNLAKHQVCGFCLCLKRRKFRSQRPNAQTSQEPWVRIVSSPEW